MSGSSPVVYNVTLTLADTEYSQALPSGTKKFSVGSQDGTAIRIAFESGKVATPTAPYVSVLANTTFESPDIDGIADITVYAASATAGTVVQIIVWR